MEDIILRAAYCPLGGTADLVVKSIEVKCFSRLRDLLRRWKTQFELMFVVGPILVVDWTRSCVVLVA